MVKKELWEICKEIYREMFKQSTPSADFDKMIKTGEAKKDNFFMKYYLEQKKQDDIIFTICKKHKLKPWERTKISNEVHLGCSPTWVKPNKKT